MLDAAKYSHLANITSLELIHRDTNNIMLSMVKKIDHKINSERNPHRMLHRVAHACFPEVVFSKQYLGGSRSLKNQKSWFSFPVAKEKDSFLFFVFL